MKELIILSKVYGVKTILLDDEDFEKLKGYKWYVYPVNGIFYARRVLSRIKGKLVYIKLHREILAISDSAVFIDHKNHNGLDNRRDNLRLATHAQNMANRKRKITAGSQFKGVGWYKPTKKWRAYIKHKFIGYFDTEIDAAMAYNEKAVEIFGEFALLNKIA